MLQEKRHDFLFYIKSNFLFGKLYACLESIYFVFMLICCFAFLIGKVYDCLESIYFVLLLVCYFVFLINNKTYRQIELSTWFQNEFSEEWRK